jgi:hypothetical protein
MKNKNGCPSGYRTNAKGECVPKSWKHLQEGESFHGILNYSEAHWGKGQTGFVLCKDGTFEMSTNKPRYDRSEGYIKSDKSAKYFPTHRDMKGSCWPGVYSFGYPDDKPNGRIWLYPHTPPEKIKKALCNIKGKFGTGDKTRVLFNATKKVLFTLGDICPKRIQTLEGVF